MRTVTVLGATGSIGSSTLDVIESQSRSIQVEALVSGRDVSGLARAAVRVGARLAVIADEAKYQDLKDALAGSGIELAAGKGAVVEAAMRPVDWTMAAITGVAGLPASYAAARRGGTLALATKECVVSAGNIFMSAASDGGTRILPVDSEHNAIFQALSGAPIEDVEKITLTASGGPFRTWTAERLLEARLEDALKHPTWAMGSKITIDSATMMNKGLELIEAHHLFAMDESKIDILVHPQSIVHGLVTYRDGSVIAGLAPADMRVAISHALGYPRRIPAISRSLDLASIGNLTFEAPDTKRFPSLEIARQALKRGDGATTILNAANEIAVEAFINGQISFSEIAQIVVRALELVEGKGEMYAPKTIDEVWSLDRAGRVRASECLPKAAARSLIGGRVAI